MKEIQGFYPNWLSPELYKKLQYDTLTTIAYFGVKALPDGTLGKESYQPDELIKTAHANNVKVVLVLYADWGSATIDTILSNFRDSIINNLLNEVQTYGFDGVDIDLEGFPATNRKSGESNKILYTQFITELSNKFWKANPNYRLSIDLPAVDWEDVFDVTILQTKVNYLMIMGYDYHWQTGPTAGAVAPLTSPNGISVTDSINNYLKLIDKHKLLLGVPYYGYEWQTQDSSHNSPAISGGMIIKYTDAITNASKYGRKWDEIWLSPYYIYGNNQGWYDDIQSLSLKYDLVNNKDLAGIGIWALGYEIDGSELSDVIKTKFYNTPEPIPQSTDAEKGKEYLRCILTYLGGKL